MSSMNRVLSMCFAKGKVLPHRLKLTFTITMIGFAIVAAGVVWGADLLKSSKDTDALHLYRASSVPSRAQGASDKNVTLLPIQLRNGGFVPKAITRQAGNYELLINNVSGELEGTLLLEHENGNRIETLTLMKARNLRKLIRLTPGNYVLRVRNQPTWLTRLTITAH